jgi:hypothetical protein
MIPKSSWIHPQNVSEYFKKSPRQANYKRQQREAWERFDFASNYIISLFFSLFLP